MTRSWILREAPIGVGSVRHSEKDHRLLTEGRPAPRHWFLLGASVELGVDDGGLLTSIDAYSVRRGWSKRDALLAVGGARSVRCTLPSPPVGDVVPLRPPPGLGRKDESHVLYVPQRLLVIVYPELELADLRLYTTFVEGGVVMRGDDLVGIWARVS